MILTAPLRPGMSPQPAPPHTPQAASQQMRLTVSSTPANPLLQVVLLSATEATQGEGKNTTHIT